MYGCICRCQNAALHKGKKEISCENVRSSWGRCWTVFEKWRNVCSLWERDRTNEMRKTSDRLEGDAGRWKRRFIVRWSRTYGKENEKMRSRFTNWWSRTYGKYTSVHSEVKPDDVVVTAFIVSVWTLLSRTDWPLDGPDLRLLIVWL